MKTETNVNVNERRANDTTNTDQGSSSASNVPKYLELLYDEGDTGYEIPRQHDHNNQQQQTRDNGNASGVEEDVSSLEHLLPHNKNKTLTPNSSLRYSNMIKTTPVSTTTDNNLCNSNINNNNNSELRWKILFVYGFIIKL